MCHSREKKTVCVCVCVCVCVNSNHQVLTFSIKTEASCSETSSATVFFSPGPPYVAVRALVTAAAATASAIYNRQLVSARLASS